MCTAKEKVLRRRLGREISVGVMVRFESSALVIVVPFVEFAILEEISEGLRPVLALWGRLRN